MINDLGLDLLNFIFEFNILAPRFHFHFLLIIQHEYILLPGSIADSHFFFFFLLLPDEDLNCEHS